MTAQILDGGAIVAAAPTPLGADPRAFLLACYPNATVAPLDHVVLTADPLLARVNHGAWIASCPCGAKGLPTPGMVVFLDLLLGWCVRCGNQAVGHGWRQIAAPPEPERREIEAVLLCRPRVEDRNWEPPETVADLVAQNREHGDPVPDLDVIRIGPLLGPTWQEAVAPFGQRARRELGPRWWQKLLGRR